jgi:hypothetical protein
MSPFLGASGALGSAAGSLYNAGFTTAADFLAGSATALGGGSGTGALTGAAQFGSMATSGLLGAGAGYAVGSLGDKLFGADTKASTGGAIGGGLGAVIGGLPTFGLGAPLGAAIGTALGSVIGGMFGSTKVKGSGIYSGSEISGENTDDLQTYIDYKKKSWFSSKSWTEYDEMSQSQKDKIEAIFDGYDYLLAQLGEFDKIVLAAGKYDDKTFQDSISKAFLSEFTGISQTVSEVVPKYVTEFSEEFGDAAVKSTETVTNTVANPIFDEVYAQWEAYAKEIDKTTGEAISEALGGMVQTERGFAEWALGFAGKDAEALSYKANYLAEDFKNLAAIMDAEGVTVENFSDKMQEALQENFTIENVKLWEQLGESLKATSEASAQLTQANEALSGTIRGISDRTRELAREQELETNATDVMKASLAVMKDGLAASNVALVDVIEQLTQKTNEFEGTYRSLEDLFSSNLNAGNAEQLLSDLGITEKTLIDNAKSISDERIAILEREKAMIEGFGAIIDDITKQMVDVQAANNSFYKSELAKVQDAAAMGLSTDTSNLSTAVSMYLDKTKSQSTSALEFLQESAKVRAELGGSIDNVTLNDIEFAINTETDILAYKLDLINESLGVVTKQWTTQAGGQVVSNTVSMKYLDELLNMDSRMYNRMTTSGYSSSLKGDFDLDTPEGFLNAYAFSNYANTKPQFEQESMQSLASYFGGSYEKGVTWDADRNIPSGGYGIATDAYGNVLATQDYGRKSLAQYGLSDMSQVSPNAFVDYSSIKNLQLPIIDSGAIITELQDLKKQFVEVTVSQKAEIMRLRKEISILNESGTAMNVKVVA